MFRRPKGMIRFGLSAAFLTAGMLRGQTDPGPRGGPASAGGYYPALNAIEQAFFNGARDVFMEVDSVSGTVAGEPGRGLGPTFNGNGCAMCHVQPAIGGSRPSPASKQSSAPNPPVGLRRLTGGN